MVGLEAITKVAEKRPQLQGTEGELTRKQRRRRRGKRNPRVREAALVGYSVRQFRRGGTPTPLNPCS